MQPAGLPWWGWMHWRWCWRLNHVPSEVSIRLSTPLLNMKLPALGHRSYLASKCFVEPDRDYMPAQAGTRLLDWRPSIGMVSSSSGRMIIYHGRWSSQWLHSVLIGQHPSLRSGKLANKPKRGWREREREKELAHRQKGKWFRTWLCLCVAILFRPRLCTQALPSNIIFRGN